MAERGELSFIRDLRRRFPARNRRGLLRGIGDDCALLRVRPGWQAAVTTDLLIEGRHFRRDTHTAESAGHRCLARGLSDLAAMGGAEPLAAFLSIALPGTTLTEASSRRWLAGFLRGFQALATETGVPLAGGDTGEAPGAALLADIVLVGQIEAKHVLLRSGAMPGDAIWVTGALGGAAAELQTMLGRAAESAQPSRKRGPQSFPEPRLAAGHALGRQAGSVTACLDISDGLSTDLHHLCEESGVAARVVAQALPLHPLATRLARSRAQPELARNLALHGGEDYELLFTARPGIPLPATLAGARLYQIGTVVKPRRGRPIVTLVEEDRCERELKRGGWEHLRS